MTLATLALPLLASILAAHPLAGPVGPEPWLAPVTPVVTERPFTPPAGPYSPGHRGVDLAADPGTVVRAPASGVVLVAGRIAGKSVVSVGHPHRILGRIGWRTTYESVLPRVEVGDVVEAGDPLGLVVSHAHGEGFHWGLKNGRAYADPMLLLRRPVVLKPVSYARGCACS